MQSLATETTATGYTWMAENILAWQALESIASDNRMSVVVDETGVLLMPLSEEGRSTALRSPEED